MSNTSDIIIEMIKQGVRAEVEAETKRQIAQAKVLLDSRMEEIAKSVAVVVNTQLMVNSIGHETTIRVERRT